MGLSRVCVQRRHTHAAQLRIRATLSTGLPSDLHSSASHSASLRTDDLLRCLSLCALSHSDLRLSVRQSVRLLYARLRRSVLPVRAVAIDDRHHRQSRSAADHLHDIQRPDRRSGSPAEVPHATAAHVEEEPTTDRSTADHRSLARSCLVSCDHLPADHHPLPRSIAITRRSHTQHISLRVLHGRHSLPLRVTRRDAGITSRTAAESSTTSTACGRRQYIQPNLMTRPCLYFSGEIPERLTRDYSALCCPGRFGWLCHRTIIARMLGNSLAFDRYAADRAES